VGNTTCRRAHRSNCVPSSDASVLRALAPAALILDVPHALSASALHWPALAPLAHEPTLRPLPLLACVPAGDDAAPRRIAALGLPSTALLRKPLTPDDLLAWLRCRVGAGPAAP